jgi:hypothetical protein
MFGKNVLIVLHKAVWCIIKIQEYGENIMTNSAEKTLCFTYKVEMVVQILAKNSTQALEKLNNIGGHMTSRKIDLLKTTELPSDLEKN